MELDTLYRGDRRGNVTKPEWHRREVKELWVRQRKYGIHE